MIDIVHAAVELRTTTMQQLQEATAWTWASRAAAAYQFYRSSNHLQWLLDAEEYAHEAIEHAALAGVLPAVQAALAPYR